MPLQHLLPFTIRGHDGHTFLSTYIFFVTKLMVQAQFSFETFSYEGNRYYTLKLEVLKYNIKSYRYIINVKSNNDGIPSLLLLTYFISI